MDYVKQDATFVDKLSDIERYLVGEEVDDTVGVPAARWRQSRLHEWCDTNTADDRRRQPGSAASGRSEAHGRWRNFTICGQIRTN